MSDETTTIRELNTFLKSNKFKFGDYLLFQEYKYDSHIKLWAVSKPILAIYLGAWICDQAIAFHYIQHINENHWFVDVDGYNQPKEVGKVEDHIEWYDYVDILGHWEKRPTWKEIIISYRKQNKSLVSSDKQVKV